MEPNLSGLKLDLAPNVLENPRNWRFQIFLKTILKTTNWRLSQTKYMYLKTKTEGSFQNQELVHNTTLNTEPANNALYSVLHNPNLCVGYIM